MPDPKDNDQESNRYVNLLTEIKDTKRMVNIMAAMTVLTLVGGGALVVASRSKCGEEDSLGTFEI